MSYPINAFIMSAFLIVLAILYYLISRRIQDSWYSNMFVVFAGVYLVLAHFSAMGAIFYATEYANSPTCEYLLNFTNSTTIGNEDDTTYQHFDPCEGRGAYEVGNNLLVIYVWTSFLVILTLGFALMRATLGWIRRW